jgi:hypothetical protein
MFMVASDDVSLGSQALLAAHAKPEKGSFREGLPPEILPDVATPAVGFGHEGRTARKFFHRARPFTKLALNQDS